MWTLLFLEVVNILYFSNFKERELGLKFNLSGDFELELKQVFPVSQALNSSAICQHIFRWETGNLTKIDFAKFRSLHALPSPIDSVSDVERKKSFRKISLFAQQNGDKPLPYPNSNIIGKYISTYGP